MSSYRKLKADQSITGLIPAIAAISVLILASILWGTMTGYRVLGVLILIFAIFQYYAFSKVRSLSYFVSATYILSGSLLLLFGSFNEPAFPKGEFSNLSKILTFTTFFLLLWLIYLLATRKTKWKGREVFELAALPVSEASAGFTERPLPSGKLTYSRNELLAFAAFLRTNHIALPFIEPEKVVLVPVKMSKEFSLLYGLRPDYLRRSWVSFGFNGDISVHIAKDDYLQYKDQLSFDKLCESMGDLFKDFFNLFLKDEGVRIVDKLDALKVSIFT